MVEDKSKKQKVEDNEEHADEELIASIGKLQEVQDELEKVNGEFGEEVLKVEQEYNAIRRPVYEKRNEAIKSIPDFWLNALLGHPAISLLLTEEDQKILKYLTSLEVDEFKDVKSGYSITFNFQPNPYFEETKLIKTFNFSDEGTSKISATPITWKEGKGVPNGVAPEKKGSKRPHAEESDSTSFFAWFSDTQPIDDDLGVEGATDEVAEIIREELWRNPLSYFIDEVDEEEDSDGEGGDEEQIDNESSEGDGEDDDDDEE